jgi:hypothetical protein
MKGVDSGKITSYGIIRYTKQYDVISHKVPNLAQLDKIQSRLQLNNTFYHGLLQYWSYEKFTFQFVSYVQIFRLEFCIKLLLPA